MESQTMQNVEKNGETLPRGVDAPEHRPGVPMEAEPESHEGAHWQEPARQPGGADHLHRSSLERPTPVFGTAQTPRGVSGAMRRSAYRIPEHYARHWLLLLLADRVDVVEDRLGSALSRPLTAAGFEGGAQFARSNPLGIVVGGIAGFWLANRLMR